MEFFPIGEHVSRHAASRGSETALISVAPSGDETVLTWAELDARANQMGRLLAEQGVEQGSRVVIGLPNSADHVIAVLATWKLGGCALPLSARLAVRERDQLLELADAAAIVADWTDVPGCLQCSDSLGFAAEPLPPVIPHPGRAIASGGSTGRSKLIVDPMPLAAPVGAFAPQVALFGLAGPQIQLAVCPLYHNFGNGWLMLGLFEGHKIVLMEKFDARLALDLIERHRPTFTPLVPTMMQRMLRVPDIKNRDLSSLTSVIHSTAPCPEWAKRAWIDLIGPERLYEVFGMTEAIGLCRIRGDEWLEHPGSIGQPFRTTVKILDEAGKPLPVKEVGEMYLKQDGLLPSSDASGVSYRYVGSESARTTPDGFTSVGDLGWVDAEGWVYLADRRVDLIIKGGVNIYPAEVEAVLSEHPAVGDVVVVGVADADLGKRVHAIVEPSDPDAPPTIEELDTYCRRSLSAPKVPSSFEFLTPLPRNEAGKIRRSALAAERSSVVGVS